MILSHKYKYIFIKTSKTAGTSIELALAQSCGPRDIITALPYEEQLVRSLGVPGPQNHLMPWWKYTLREFARRIRRGKTKVRYYDHMSAAEIRRTIGKTVWNTYFKFCFERNPFDRVISLYFWQTKKPPRPTLTEFLNTPEPLRLKQHGIGNYTIDGKIVVDRVCRYERLEADLEEVRLRLGLPEPLVLPRAKSETREDRRHYREVLNEEQRRKIETLFSEELSLHGYTY